MVDFFSNLNSKIVQPILGNVAEKAGELQDNGQVDLPVLQNIAGQLGISEEKYEKIEDGLFGLAEGVLSAAAPIIDKVAPVADQVFDMLLQSLGNGKFTAVSSTTNDQNDTESAAVADPDSTVDSEPVAVADPDSTADSEPVAVADPDSTVDSEPVDDVQVDNPVSNNGLLSDEELADRKDQIDKAFASGNTADFEKAWNDMSPEQQAQVMEAYNGDMLHSMSVAFENSSDRQKILDTVVANVVKTKGGPELLAKELYNSSKGMSGTDENVVYSILNSKSLSAQNTSQIISAYQQKYGSVIDMVESEFSGNPNKKIQANVAKSLYEAANSNYPGALDALCFEVYSATEGRAGTHDYFLSEVFGENKASDKVLKDLYNAYGKKDYTKYELNVAIAKEYEIWDPSLDDKYQERIKKAIGKK